MHNSLYLKQRGIKPNIAPCPYNINKYRRCIAVNRPVINEKLIESCEIDFGGGKAAVNEYSTCLTKDELELNRIVVKNILVKIFGKSGEADL